MGRWMDLVRHRARTEVTVANKARKIALALCESNLGAMNDRPMFS